MPSSSLHALAYGPGLPAEGERVRVEVGSHSLRVRLSSGRDLEVSFEDLNSRQAGWRGDGLLLDWKTADGAYSLALADPDDLAALRHDAPGALRARLETWQRAARRSNRVLHGWLTVAALAVLTPFVLVGLLLLNADRIVGAAVARIPLAWEEQLGELVVAQSIAEAGQWPEGEATAILDDLTRRLLAHVDSPYAFRSYLIDNAQANAFAVPGGVVVVWTGLLRETERPEELAGVLAHEMQHVVQRHTMRALVHGLGLRVALEILLGGRGTLGDLAAQMVQQFGALQFSRDQETQADLAAVEVLQAAGIDPTGLVTFFERMGSRAGEPAAILSTHPPSAERAERIRDRLAASRSFAPLPYDWPAVRQEFEGAPGRGP